MREDQPVKGSLALDKAPKVIEIRPLEQMRTRRLRVAAYARVSSDSEDQLHSFAAQNAYYVELINSNPQWEFVDVYADEGITGTSAEKRDDFQRMLADCRKGRIDRILTKSSTRFARNTEESLETIRELKLLGVSVYFEEQNLDTSELSGELITAIFSLLAQKGSETISENLRWSIYRRMRAGKYNTCRAPFGYRMVNGKFTIVEGEAAIVQYIYNAYLTGKAAADIKKALNTLWGERTWHVNSIDYILTNERYCGNALLRKSYKTMTLPRKKMKNRGQYPMYYVTGINEPIISQEVFDKAQELRKRRADQMKPSLPGQKPLLGWMRCGNCGRRLRPKQVSGRWYMACRKHEESAAACQLPPIPEETVINASLALYAKLQRHGEGIFTQLIRDLQSARSGRLLWSMDIVNLNHQIADLTRQERLLAELKQQGLVDPDAFVSRGNALAEQLRQAKLEKERLMVSEEDQTIQRTQDLLDALREGPEFLDTFDGELFSELVEQIVAESEECLRFRLINGVELTEKIERMVR